MRMFLCRSRPMVEGVSHVRETMMNEHHYVNGMEHDARLGTFVFAREMLRVP